MSSISPAIKKETGYVALWVAVAILPVQIVFALCGWWQWSVLWGSLLGSVTAVGNVLLVGLMVQKAVQQAEKQAKSTVRFSQGGRLLMQGAVLVLAACLPQAFNIWATALPLLVPNIAVRIRGLYEAKRNPSPQRPAVGWEDEEDQ